MASSRGFGVRLHTFAPLVALACGILRLGGGSAIASIVIKTIFADCGFKLQTANGKSMRACQMAGV